MDILSEDFCAWLGDARRDMERDMERRKEALEDQQRVVLALQKVEEIANENESLREKLVEEKRALAELGQEYRPDIGRDAARRMMHGFIKDTPGLSGALRASGWNGKNVTPRIRKVFYEYLGEV